MCSMLTVKTAEQCKKSIESRANKKNHQKIIDMVMVSLY